MLMLKLMDVLRGTRVRTWDMRRGKREAGLRGTLLVSLHPLHSSVSWNSLLCCYRFFSCFFSLPVCLMTCVSIDFLDHRPHPPPKPPKPPPHPYPHFRKYHGWTRKILMYPSMLSGINATTRIRMKHNVICCIIKMSFEKKALRNKKFNTYQELHVAGCLDDREMSLTLGLDSLFKEKKWLWPDRSRFLYLPVSLCRCTLFMTLKKVLTCEDEGQEVKSLAFFVMQVSLYSFSCLSQSCETKTHCHAWESISEFGQHDQ